MKEFIVIFVVLLIQWWISGAFQNYTVCQEAVDKGYHLSHCLFNQKPDNRPGDRTP